MWLEPVVDVYKQIIETMLGGCLLVGGIAISISVVIFIWCTIAIIIDLINIIKEKFE